jgi:hypothetical protein
LNTWTWGIYCPWLCNDIVWRKIRNQSQLHVYDYLISGPADDGRRRLLPSGSAERFPNDFIFPWSRAEIEGISQIVTSANFKFSKNVRVFTELGVAMLSGVLRSKRAIQLNIQIMRTFTKLRSMLATHKELKRKIDMHFHSTAPIRQRLKIFRQTWTLNFERWTCERSPFFPLHIIPWLLFMAMNQYGGMIS